VIAEIGKNLGPMPLMTHDKSERGRPVIEPGAPACLVVFSFSVPIETEGAPSFAESAVLILRSEQRVGGEDVGRSGRSAAIMIDNDHA
jgi:hypothetical protein